MLLQCLTSQAHDTHTGVLPTDGKDIHSPTYDLPCKQYFADFADLHLHSDGLGYTTADAWVLEASALLTFVSIAFSTA